MPNWKVNIKKFVKKMVLSQIFKYKNDKIHNREISKLIEV